jgi:hypothetical protein
MVQVTTIGLDIAKQVFQVDGADRVGRAVLRRKLSGVRWRGSSPSSHHVWWETAGAGEDRAAQALSLPVRAQAHQGADSLSICCTMGWISGLAM